jgi:hypothetical protein
MIVQISEESIKAHLDDMACKPGSNRGCIQSMMKDNGPESQQMSTESIASLSLQVIATGKPTGNCINSSH